MCVTKLKVSAESHTHTQSIQSNKPQYIQFLTQNKLSLYFPASHTLTDITDSTICSALL